MQEREASLDSKFDHTTEAERLQVWAKRAMQICSAEKPVGGALRNVHGHGGVWAGAPERRASAGVPVGAGSGARRAASGQGCRYLTAFLAFRKAGGTKITPAYSGQWSIASAVRVS